MITSLRFILKSILPIQSVTWFHAIQIFYIRTIILIKEWDETIVKLWLLFAIKDINQRKSPNKKCNMFQTINTKYSKVS